MKRLVKDDIYWIGKMDWELETFHGTDFSINHGSSQNAYLVTGKDPGDKTVLIDTVWMPHDEEFVANLDAEVGLDNIDAIILNHSEQDHSGSLPLLMSRIPDVPIYCTATAHKFLVGQYHHPEWNYHDVKTGDELVLGEGRTFKFVQLMMMHWPDTMGEFLTGSNVLFTNDAFGQHYACEELFNDRADQGVLYTEAIKYYANIVGPFSSFVKKKLVEIAGMDLPIQIIAPSHGVIWRDDPLQIVRTYSAWCDSYKEDQVTIAYDTMWEETSQLAHALADKIAEISPSTVVKVFNIAKSDKNDIMTEVFKSKAIAVGSPTVLRDVLSTVEGWLAFLKELNFTDKKAAVFGCYGWSGEGNKVLRDRLTDAGFEVVEPEVKSYWAPTADEFAKLGDVAKALLS